MCKHERDGDGTLTLGEALLVVALALIVGAIGGGRIKETDALASCKALGTYRLAGVRVECRPVVGNP